jgi:organic radical activating enzyme
MSAVVHSPDAGVKYPVMEDFYTLQGEGYFQGQAAYFIRLGGCDVGCVWCDVKESWDAGKHPLQRVEYLVKKVAATPARIVVITGGEPLMHDLAPLTRELKRAGFRTHVETSGAYPSSGEIDWICLSPKKFKAALPGIMEKAQELKVIIYNKSDFEWAEQHAEKVSPGCRLFLQPEWSVREKMMPLIIAYIKENPRWELSLQIHKYIHVP